MGNEIRVLVIDDHAAVGTALAMSLAALPDIDVVGVAISLAQARSMIQSLRPTVVLADIDLDGELTLGLPAELGRNGPAILFVSGHASPAIVGAAIAAGGAGYVHKSEPFDRLTAGIRTAAAGGTVLSREYRARLSRAPRAPSAREREVIAGLARGEANKEIAASLGIKERTVESHLRRLFNRYGTANRTELAIQALREEWVRP